MSNYISGEVSLVEVYRQELITGVELATIKYPESTRGIVLHAPFIDFDGLLKRPGIAVSPDSATSQLCKVSLSPHAVYGSEINLETVNGVMGRPVLGVDDGGSFEGDFGDNGCNEAFTQLSLSVFMDGGAVFRGLPKNKKEPVPLNYVTSREMYRFGVAILNAINKHQNRSKEPKNTAQ